MNAPLSLAGADCCDRALPLRRVDVSPLAADGLARVRESSRQTSLGDIGVRNNGSVAVGAGFDAERLDQVIDVTGHPPRLVGRSAVAPAWRPGRRLRQPLGLSSWNRSAQTDRPQRIKCSDVLFDFGQV